MTYKSIDEIIERAKSSKRVVRLAVAAAQEGHTLQAVLQARDDGLVAPYLVGDTARIRALIAEMGTDDRNCVLVEASEDGTPKAAVALVREGKAELLMKGNLHTAKFLKAVLSREEGLMKGTLLSHLALTELPGYHKLLAITDTAIATQPDLEGKRGILNNALGALASLGYTTPKIAVLTAVETINPKMQDTVDAAALKQLCQEGALATDCIVEGPISADLAFSSEAAEIKGFESPVVGDPDLLLMPNIAAGNILIKCLKQFTAATTVGIALGAVVPIILTSRGTSVQAKYKSIALGAAMA